MGMSGITASYLLDDIHLVIAVLRILMGLLCGPYEISIFKAAFLWRI